MFAYCNNNPVMGYDPYGEWDFWSSLKEVGKAAIEAAVTVAVTVTTAATLLTGASIIATGGAAAVAVPAVATAVAATVVVCGAVAAVGAVAVVAGEIGENITYDKIHGNSLDNPSTNYGYALKDNVTDEVIKYGESIRGKSRYTKKFYDENKCYMDIQDSGTKRSIHNWQHNKIIEHILKYGQKPRLNRSLW